MRAPRLSRIRPLVRYVDESQAVIDAHLTLLPPLEEEGRPAERADVLVEITGSDGSIDEQRLGVRLREHAGVVRMQVVRPERWWPAGMGEQALYRISLGLLWRGEVVDSRAVTVGFTSVRAQDAQAGRAGAEWLVNSQVCAIEAVVPIDLVHERRLLPVAGHSLLVVRGHYGPDVLYDAADRAGLLLIQCVPIDEQGRPEEGVAEEVDRLASHPSLAGWVVGHLGRVADGVASRIMQLDPTRRVFREVPGL